MLRQLSSQDASFLYQDSPSTPMHVGSVAILDPTKSPYGALTLETVTQFYRERLHLMPTARRRLVNVPFGLDHPYWIEDENFDLEYHIREVGLPEPHDWRQFYTLAARILSRPLDMTRPPWETYIIHGLDHLENIPSGCIGLLSKMHHCAIDGQSGMEMAMAMADLTPEVTEVKPPKEPWKPDEVPSDLELTMRMYSNNSAATDSDRRARERNPTRCSQRLSATFRRSECRRSRAHPENPLQRGRSRRTASIGFKRFLLDEVRAMKNAVADATVNDVVLAICGGALRAYLDRETGAACRPTRGDGADQHAQEQGRLFDGQPGQRNVHRDRHTHRGSQSERLQNVRDLTRSAKEMTNAIGADLMTRYGDFYPAATQNLAARLTAEYARGNDVTPPFNCSITNVPGPQVPLYTMGCETVTTLGYGPIVHNMGLIIPVRATTANSASASRPAAT